MTLYCCGVNYQDPIDDREEGAGPPNHTAHVSSTVASPASIVQQAGAGGQDAALCGQRPCLHAHTCGYAVAQGVQATLPLCAVKTLSLIHI